MRAGAKSISRDVAGRVRSTVGGGGRAKQADVWETATTEELTEEPPECQWCPICRAARRYRESGGQGQPPGFGGQFGQFGQVGDTLAGLTRDAFSLFDAAMKASQRPPASAGTSAPGTPGKAAPGAATPGTDPWGTSTAPAEGTTPPAPTTPTTPTTPAAPEGPPSDDGAVIVGPGVGWPTVVHPEHQHDEAADERGNRQEGGQPGDGGPAGGTDEQVERTSE
jgi:hypothetical protein